jgi:hypothetical protein
MVSTKHLLEESDAIQTMRTQLGNKQMRQIINEVLA